MSITITDPNTVVEQLATIFYYSLKKSELGRLVMHVQSGRKALCGKNLHWWWRDGLGCPATFASLDVIPSGAMNTWCVSSYEQSDVDGLVSFRLAKELHCRLINVSHNLKMDYVDIMGVATPAEVRRASLLAQTRADSLD
jgi:hypothetical protein